MLNFSTTYTPGIGWQFVVHRDGVLMGRYGNFETEAGALASAHWPVKTNFV